MPWKEKLYERTLKRPIDDEARAAIDSEVRRRQNLIPMPTDLSWSDAKPELTIRSRWVSFIVDFTDERMVVNAKLTLAAKMFATDENRRQAVRFIEGVADELDL